MSTEPDLPPPVDGWRERLIGFDLGNQYVYATVTDADGTTTHKGLIGAPIEWTLLRWDADTVRFESTPMPCSVTGAMLTPASDDPNWGVRCARCGAALHVRSGAAHMRLPTDPPACAACVSTVQEIRR